MYNTSLKYFATDSRNQSQIMDFDESWPTEVHAKHKQEAELYDEQEEDAHLWLDAIQEPVRNTHFEHDILGL